MYLDPAMLPLVIGGVVIVLIGLIMRWLKQPHVLGYLLAGVVLGPHGLAVYSNPELAARLGAAGVVLLLFFVGMEVSPRQLVANWRINLLGTALQIAISVGAVWLVGEIFDWPAARRVLLGFVISMSSTAVVMKLLSDWNELDTRTGRDVLGITLAQDLAVIPMLLVLSSLSGTPVETGTLVIQGVGMLAIIGVLAWLALAPNIHLPLGKWLGADHELQVFVALTACFATAALTALIGLSTAMGAFVAGMLIGAAKETQWVRRSLQPFQVVFVAVFFTSVGLLVDLEFLRAHWLEVLLVVIAVFLTNTLINALTLRMFGDSWRSAIYGGSMLANIGEFSFVLAAVALHASIITGYSHQMTIIVIASTLILSPAWIMLARKLVGRPQP